VRSLIEDPNEASAAWIIFQAQSNLHDKERNFIMGAQLLPENFTTLGCLQCHTFSRGSSHISSADIDACPDIDPRYFSNPIDLEILARHLQAIETLRCTPELSSLFKPDGKRNHEDSYHIKDLDAAKKYLLDTAGTTYHTCGTAAMLPSEKGGVVDEKLIVYGTSNLRIVDASIFPLIPCGNIQSTVYAVADRAAYIVKGL
jgi:choline dehydrogenase-like flavoprotein